MAFKFQLILPNLEVFAFLDCMLAQTNSFVNNDNHYYFKNFLNIKKVRFQKKTDL